PRRTAPRPPLLAQRLALRGRHLSPALAELFTRIGTHLPPALLVSKHALAFLRRHRLPLTQPLLDPVPPLLRQPLVALVGLLQLLLALPGQLVPALEVLEDLRPLIGRELADAPVVLTRRLALIGGCRVPQAVIIALVSAFVYRQWL